MDDKNLEKNIKKLKKIEEIQIKNIDAILLQADKLKILEEKSEKLEANAKTFFESAHKLKTKTVLKKVRDQLTVLAIVFFAVFITYILRNPTPIVLGVALCGGILFLILSRYDCKKKCQDNFGSDGFENKKILPLVSVERNHNASINASIIAPVFYNSTNKKIHPSAPRRVATHNEDTISHALKK